MQVQTEPPDLILAISAEDAATVEDLLAAGADPNVQFQGRTPLMFAIYGEHVGIFRLLLENGAELEQPTDAPGPLLTMAAETGNVEIIGLLLDAGEDIDATESHGQTPLMLAVHNGRPETAEYLPGAGANPDIQEENGWTALMFASMHGDLPSTNHLIAAGCDVNLKTTDGEAPLARARKVLEAGLGQGGDYEGVIAALIAAGAGGG